MSRLGYSVVGRLIGCACLVDDANETCEQALTSLPIDNIDSSGSFVGVDTLLRFAVSVATRSTLDKSSPHNSPRKSDAEITPSTRLRLHAFKQGIFNNHSQALT